AGAPHPKIALPSDLFGVQRINSAGIDLASEPVRARIAAALAAARATPFAAGPIVAGRNAVPADVAPVSNPADRGEVVGGVAEAQPEDIEHALAAASAAAADWAATPAAARSEHLERAAALFEREADTLLALAVREAGKSWANAVAELREAVDFLRYYAQQARGFDAASHVALGPVLCISPWNFPLAIFSGQVAAALAAGNPVLAKPAEQTPLIAAFAVRLLHEAGIPPAALQLLPGRGETVGAALVADARVRGVMFTGSTEVAALINRTLA